MKSKRTKSKTKRKNASDSLSSLQKEIYELLGDNLDVKEKEKSKLGEVFTPVSMIETLYSHFPKSIWKNPKIKWIDPSAGIGNFSLVLFFHLMNGLKDKIPNPNKRSKYIIENMIYIVEINKKNSTICKSIFNKICKDASPNIYNGDFLKLNTEKIGWTSTFDCIVGNPPYNIDGTKNNGIKRAHIAFAEKGLNLISKNGFLAFICPPSYRENETQMNILFNKHNGYFRFIKIYGSTETNKLFNIQARVDSFIYQKNSSGQTLIIDEYDRMHKMNSLNINNHIPNFGFNIFKKLHKKVLQLGHLDAFRNTDMSSIKSNLFRYNGRYKILHLIISNGKRILKSNKKHYLTDTPKILVNGLGIPYVFYDRKGEYGPSQSPVVILKPNRNTVNFLQSPFFSFVAWGMKLTGNNNLPYLFDMIPNFENEHIRNFYKYFDLTSDEIKFIETNFEKHIFIDKDLIQNNNISKPTTKSKRK
jgi:hypothetical protein